MASIEICPRCGAEARVYIHTTSAGVAVLSGRCGHCDRLIAYRLTPEPEPKEHLAPQGKLVGWEITSWDEDRGRRTRRYNLDEEKIMRRHVIEYEETLTHYTLEEVRV